MALAAAACSLQTASSPATTVALAFTSLLTISMFAIMASVSALATTSLGCSSIRSFFMPSTMSSVDEILSRPFS